MVKDSVILLEQLRTIDKQRLREKICHIDGELLGRVDEALKAEEMLAAEGISAKVIDMFTWKPIDEELIVASAKETGAIVTAENHQVKCGLGSAVAQVVAKNTPVPMEMVGIEDRFGQVGAQNFLQEEYGLTAAHIVEAAKKAISRK